MQPTHSHRPVPQPRAGAPGPELVSTGQPRVGIYCGGGASHSWLWFAEIFERLGLGNLSFLDEHSLQSGQDLDLDALAISGGDTFGVARSLGPAGARSIERFIRQGGTYLGSCAGAYLLMHSSLEPLDQFNLVRVKIANLSRLLPQPLMLAEKFSTAYGCSYVFHPVREAVNLAPQAEGLFSGCSRFKAPLYGGPAMLAGDGCQVLATYQGFDQATQFLADPELARQTLLGKAAVVYSGLGRGHIYLFGPHLEHPGYSQANQMLARCLPRPQDRSQERPLAGGRPRPLMDGPQAADLLRILRRELSNSRIVAVGLEDHPARWLIGQKVYEPMKLRVFLEAMWQRLKPLERAAGLAVDQDQAQDLAQGAQDLTGQLRRLRQELTQDRSGQELAQAIFPALNRLAAGFLQVYFDSPRARARRGLGPRRLH